ncbi:MAG: EAL domain-containing protein [Clostridium sp.]|nr:EAL domain-containing protein [Clostridium sp.]
MRVFWATFFCLVFDILSIVAIWHRHLLGAGFVKLIAKSYLVTLLFVAYTALTYMCVDMFETREMYRKRMKLYTALLAAGIAGTYAAPIDYHYAEDGKTVLYTHGPSLFVTYGMALVFFAIIFYMLVQKKGKINPRRREAVFIWLIIWIVASQIQFMYTNILIVGYAGAIGIMVLYLKLENPETNLDRQTGMFNGGALHQYTRQMFAKKKDFSAVGIFFEDIAYQNITSEKREAVKMEIIEYFLKIPEALPFKNSQGEIIMLFRDTDMAERQLEEMRQRFMLGWGDNDKKQVHPKWLFLPHANVINRTEDFYELIRWARDDEKQFTENDLCRISDEMVDKINRKNEMGQLIIDAINNDRVDVFYQPIFSTDQHRFTAAEALVRIWDDDGKLVMPGAFIDIAEESGMILKLGELVFERVCRFIKENPLEHFGLQYMEVNLSVVQCAYDYLATDYIRIMDKYGVDPKFVNLEITESASTNAKKTLLENMEALIGYGVSFSLDDFGTGQSNLNYIVDMPVEIVKFDKSMTNAYFENRKAKYVMDAAIHMIHGMGLKIVSEGIETEEQYRTMEELGINHIQGYYFSKPLSEKEFITFLNNRKEVHM